MSLCLSAVMWIYLGLSIPSPRCHGWTCQYAEQSHRRALIPVRNREPCYCLNTHSRVKNERQGAAVPPHTEELPALITAFSSLPLSCAKTPAVPLEESHLMKSLFSHKSHVRASPTPRVASTWQARAAGDHCRRLLPHCEAEAGFSAPRGTWEVTEVSNRETPKGWPWSSRATRTQRVQSCSVFICVSSFKDLNNSIGCWRRV